MRYLQVMEPHAEPGGVGVAPAGGSAFVAAEYTSTVVSLQLAAYAAGVFQLMPLGPSAICCWPLERKTCRQ